MKLADAAKQLIGKGALSLGIVQFPVFLVCNHAPAVHVDELSEQCRMTMEEHKMWGRGYGGLCKVRGRQKIYIRIT